MTRIRTYLLAVLCLILIAVGYLLAKPAILNERAVRTAVKQHLVDWTGAIVTFGSKPRVSYFPRLTLEIRKFRMSGIKHLPALREIRAKRVLVRLGLWSLVSGTPVVDRVTLVEPRIESSAVGRVSAGRSISNEAPALVKALATAPFDQIVLVKGVVSVAGPQTTEEFGDVNAKINLRRSGSAHGSHGYFTWRDQTVTFRYNGGNPVKTANTVKMPVTVSIGGALLSAEIDGEAAITDGLRVTGNLELRIHNLPRFAKWTGLLVPDDQKSGDFSANGTFHWAGHRIGFDEGSFALDGNRALGALALEFGGPRPQIEGTLALQKLNLTQYLQAGAAPDSENQPDKKPGKPKSVDVDFPLLHHLDVDLRISTTELAAAPLSVGQSALSLTLNSGRLAADIAIFDVCGGNGNGRLEFDATVPDSAIRLTANLSGVSAQSCIEIFTPDSRLEGTADMVADVTSKGRTLNELIAGVGGKVSLSMTAGQASVDIAKLVANLRNGPVVGWDAAQGSATAFQGLAGDFFFRTGSVYTDSLKINLGTRDLVSEGTIYLAERKLDMRMMLMDRPPAEGTLDEKKPEASPTGVIVMKGPWSEPSFSLEPAKSRAELATPPVAPPSARRGNF